MFDFNHLFPNGIYPPQDEAKPAKPLRSPEELAESLLRWKCEYYGPGHQCHICDDCKPFKLCGLCQDLKEAASLLLEALEPKTIVTKVCLHGKLREECGPCKPQPPGAQD